MKTFYPVLLTVVLALVPTLAKAQAPAATNGPATPAVAPTAPVLTADDAALLSLPDPVVGDSYNNVITVLGKPNGVISMPDKSSLLIYNRGTILITDSKVAEIKFLPLATYNAKVAAESASEADRQVNIARANALLQMLLADPQYKDMSTRDRILSLAKFDREHPGSEARQYISDLQAVYSAELQAQAHIDKLQSEVAQARSQAASAQQQVADAQKKLVDAQQSKTTLQAQADRAREQAALANNQLATKPPLVVPNNNVPGSTVGAGGSALINNTYTSPPPANGAANPGANPAAPTDAHWVMGTDGTMKLVPGSNGATGN